MFLRGFYCRAEADSFVKSDHFDLNSFPILSTKLGMSIVIDDEEESYYPFQLMAIMLDWQHSCFFMLTCFQRSSVACLRFGLRFLIVVCIVMIHAYFDAKNFVVTDFGQLHISYK